MPPPAGWREAREATERAGGGGGGGGAAAAAAAAAGGGGGGGAAAGDAEFAHPCPICLDNEDDATVDGRGCWMCYACGQMYCGACKGGLVDRSPNCPTCRAPFAVSHEEEFKRLWKLVHDRSPGRHTPVAQNSLGTAYDTGDGIEQDYTEAVKWYRKAGEQGYAMAQYNLGAMYGFGLGVEQDHTEAVEWYRKAAEQGYMQMRSSALVSHTPIVKV